tara:strand:- start:127 stop:1662 length:1536 start_codon:yes stop_codon:yes gene_type:complete
MYPKDGIELTDFSSIVPPAFDVLSFELFLYLTRTLSLQDIAALAATNKMLRAWVNSEDFWTDRLHAHFPHISRSITDPQLYTYKSRYRYRYEFEYGRLSGDEKYIFNLVKIGDADEIAKRFDNKNIAMKWLFIRDNRGKSLVDWARMQGHQSMLNVFYANAKKFYVSDEGSFSPKMQDAIGYTLLHWAMEFQQSEDEIELLLATDEKIALDITDKKRRTPLHLAACYHSEAVCSLLVDKGASITAQDKFGFSPLSMAMSKDSRQNVEAMLMLQKDRSLQDSVVHKPDELSLYRVAFSYAAWRNDMNFVRLLLQKLERIPGSELTKVVRLAADCDDDDIVRQCFEVARNTGVNLSVMVQRYVLTNAVFKKEQKVAKLFLDNDLYSYDDFRWIHYEARSCYFGDVSERALSFIKIPMLAAYIEKMEQRVQHHGEDYQASGFGVFHGVFGFGTGTRQYTLWGFGYTAKQKLDAARALQQQLDNSSEDEAELEAYKAPLEQGELGTINRLFRRGS